MVNLLLESQRVNINEAPSTGESALYLAAYNGFTNVVRLLLGAVDIDVNKGNENGQTPLDCAADNGHLEVVTLLITHPHIITDTQKLATGQTPLASAAANGHLAIVELLSIPEPTPTAWFRESAYHLYRWLAAMAISPLSIDCSWRRI